MKQQLVTQLGMLHTSGRDDCWDDRSNARPLCWARWKASTLVIHLRGPCVFEHRAYIVPLNQKNPWSTSARGVRHRRRYNRLEFPGGGPIPDTVHSFCLGLVSIYHGKFSQRSVQLWQGEGASSVPEVFTLGMLAASSSEFCVRVGKVSVSLSAEVSPCAHWHMSISKPGLRKDV